MTRRQSEPDHYDTIVIGAGMAGLSCASRLYKHPRFQNSGSLLVLEARDRIGGRIGAVSVDGKRLDTGANWIHGVGTKEKPNPLMSVLPHKRYRPLSGSILFRAPDDEDSDASTPSRLLGDGTDWVRLDRKAKAQHDIQNRGNMIVPADQAGKIMATLWEMIEGLHDVAAKISAHDAKNRTMLDAISSSDSLREAFEDTPKQYHHTLSSMPQFVENMEAGPLAVQSAEHDYDRTSMSLLEFGIEDFDGDQVFLQDGYLAVIDEVAKDLVTDGIIKLEVDTQQIRQETDHITLRTNAGTYTANRVVCTMPLGVLQHRLDVKGTSLTPLFRPQLPRDKVEAISSLGFGTLDKIFLVYSDAWWSEGPYTEIFAEGLGQQLRSGGSDHDHPPSELGRAPDTVMGFTRELPGINIKPDGTVSAGPRALSLINLKNLTGFPVLQAFVSCANAVYIESLSDDDASSLVHRALSNWLGQEPPRPNAVHVTRWRQDEFSRGSYTHMVTGVSETKHREAFQKPIIGSGGAELRFAGEHTSRNHFATVHGALISGWREANAILEHEKQLP